MSPPHPAQFPRIRAIALLATAALGRADLVELTSRSIRLATVASGGWPAYLQMVLTMKAINNVPVVKSIFALAATEATTATGAPALVAAYVELLALARLADLHSPTRTVRGGRRRHRCAMRSGCAATTMLDMGGMADC